MKLLPPLFYNAWLLLLCCVLNLSVNAQDQLQRFVSAGDRLRVSIEEQYSLDKVYPVSGDGTIEFKSFGRVFVSNKTLPEAAIAIQNFLEGEFFKVATVTVSISEYVEGEIRITGAVKSPTAVPMTDGSLVTLFEAITKAGGLSSRANSKEVKILRWEPGQGLKRQIITVDVQEMFKSLDFSKDEYLRPRDIVFVPSTGGDSSQEVLLIGEVGAVGYHSYYEGLNVLRLIANTGGIPRSGRPDAARILRASDTGDYSTIPVDISMILARADMSQNYDLKPGDILYIPPVDFAQAGSAFVLGEVGQKGPIQLPLNGELGVARAMLGVGLTAFSNTSKVKLIRVAPDGEKHTIYVDTKHILDTGDFEDDVPLQDGDIIIVQTKYINI